MGAASACSSEPAQQGVGGSSSSSSSSASTSGGKGGADNASSSASSLVTNVASVGGGGAGGGCAAVSAKADPIPLDLLLMVDQSGSMLMDAGNGMSRWDTIKTAIASFVQEPQSAGIGLGIQYFGLPQVLNPACKNMACTTDADCGGCFDCGMNGYCVSATNTDVDSCDGEDYSTPEVGIQPLPGVGGAILTSLGQHAPGTNTPTYPALVGAVGAMIGWATQNPTHVSAVAFATDGEPSECDTDLNDIDDVAAAGVASTPSVRTFVIGVGPALSALDGIAAAGGTLAAFHVDVNAMAEQDLLDALNTIRDAAVACTYTIPPPPEGQTIDPSEVNVTYLPGDGGPKETIPHVADAMQCPAKGDAWYYDDPKNPTEVILCSATCAGVTADFDAEIDVDFGCQTILL